MCFFNIIFAMAYMESLFVHCLNLIRRLFGFCVNFLFADPVPGATVKAANILAAAI